MPKKIWVNPSKPHVRRGGWVQGGRGYTRNDSRLTINQGYYRRLPRKRKKKKTKEKKVRKTRQTRFGTPRTRPARRSLQKRES